MGTCLSSSVMFVVDGILAVSWSIPPNSFLCISPSCATISAFVFERSCVSRPGTRPSSLERTFFRFTSDVFVVLLLLVRELLLPSAVVLFVFALFDASALSCRCPSSFVAVATGWCSMSIPAAAGCSSSVPCMFRLACRVSKLDFLPSLTPEGRSVTPEGWSFLAVRS